MSKNFTDLGYIAQTITDDIESMGQTAMYAMLSPKSGDGITIDIRLDYSDATGWRRPPQNELVAAGLLELFPGSTLKREREYGQPAEIKIVGSINGEMFEIKVGTGVEAERCTCDHCKAERRA